MSVRLPLNAQSPIPAGVTLTAPPGGELPSVSLALESWPQQVSVWRFRLYAHMAGRWVLVGECEPRASRYVYESPVLLAEACAPGAVAWHLVGWPQSLASGLRAEAILAASGFVGAGGPGLRVVERWAKKWGERHKVTSGVLGVSSSATVAIPAGGRVKSWAMWSAGSAGGATASLGASVVTLPPNGAMSGTPDLPGAVNCVFATPAAVTGGYLVEWVE